MRIKTRILDLSDKKDENFLRRKTSAFDFGKHAKKEIDELIKTMRSAMDDNDGVGLAANQIGLDMSVFVARFDNKFYAFFNPKIAKTSPEKIAGEEGCLSISDKVDVAYRHEKITLLAEDRRGKKVKIKCWGLLARIFQHEVDHLNGMLFIDRTKE